MKDNTIHDLLQASAGTSSINKGYGTKVFEFADPDLKNYLIKDTTPAKRSAIPTLSVNAELSVMPDEYQGRNFGQTIFSINNNISIVLRSGTCLTYSYKTNKSNYLATGYSQEEAVNLAYMNSLDQISILPQSSFDKLVSDLKILHSQKKTLDSEGINIALTTSGHLKIFDVADKDISSGDTALYGVSQILHSLTKFHLMDQAHTEGQHNAPLEIISDKVYKALDANPASQPIIINPQTEIEQLGPIKLSLSAESLKQHLARLEKSRSLELVM